MPYLIRTFNHAKMYNLCFWMFPFVFPLLALLNVIARAGYDGNSGKLSAHASAAIWVGVALILAMSRIAGLAFGWVHCFCLSSLAGYLSSYSFSVILIKENCPNSASLGTSNASSYIFLSFVLPNVRLILKGMAQFAMCLARAFSPAFMRCVASSLR